MINYYLSHAVNGYLHYFLVYFTNPDFYSQGYSYKLIVI